jgi:hypothetical protein
VLIRLACSWLGQWHEPLVVGAAVTLISMAYLLPAASRAPDQRASAGSSGKAAAVQGHQPALPADDQYYRDQWARETQQFYAQQRPRQSPGAETIASSESNDAPPSLSRVVPAAAAAAAQGPVAQEPVAPPVVAQAYHADHAPRRTVAQGSKTAVKGAKLDAPPITKRVRQWRVLSCVAAGALASLLFAALWPVAAARSQRSSCSAEQSAADAIGATAPRRQKLASEEAIEIRLPAAWVRVRPTMSQTLRRGVLGSSYMMAAIGSWAMLAR